MIAATLTLSPPPAPIFQSASVSELCVSVFSSPDHSPFNSNPSTRNLASFVDALDAASSLSPLFATLTKNTRGWGVPSFSANSVPGVYPDRGVKIHIQPRPALSPQLTGKSRIICTYAKPARNSFTMNTSKTQDLKPFRMNTYRKRGEGVGGAGGNAGLATSLARLLIFSAVSSSFSLARSRARPRESRWAVHHRTLYPSDFQTRSTAFDRAHRASGRPAPLPVPG